MIKDYKKDHIIRSFLDSLYIEKGLSKNTVSSYKNDISSFLSWLNKKQINYLVKLMDAGDGDSSGGSDSEPSEDNLPADKADQIIPLTEKKDLK